MTDWNEMDGFDKARFLDEHSDWLENGDPTISFADMRAELEHELKGWQLAVKYAHDAHGKRLAESRVRELEEKLAGLENDYD